MRNKKTVITLSLLFSFLYSIFYIPTSTPPALAFESSSGSFEIHAGAIESTTGTSSSASFKNTNSAGESVPGTSIGTSKEVFSSVIHWLYGFFIAQYTQSHFRWRNDDGGEGCPTTCGTGASMATILDTQLTNVAKWTVKRVRFLVSNEGWTRGSPPAFRLEVAQAATCSSGTYSAVPTDYSADWHMATSTNFADEDTTSNIFDGGGTVSALTDENANFVQGRMKETANTTSSITLNSDNFTEIEFAVLATATATGPTQYCFRVTNSGSTVNMVYPSSGYATAAIASGLAATGTLDSAVFDAVTPTGTLQGPAYNSIMWKGSQNGSSGKVQFQFATSDSSSGPWNFYGSQSGTCNTSNYYDTTGTDVPVELSCSPTYHNNQRYFRYRIRICSLDCNTGGSASPIVNDVIVNWAP